MPSYNSFGMSPIRRRNPIGMNIGAFADVVSKLDTKYQEMAKQQSAIDMAIGQLPVNAAEDAWRMGVADEIRNQINSVDNPNDRYLTAIRAAGQLMSRPDVVGRIRAQAEYKNFVEQNQKRTDIGQDVKDWALANNQYTYQDKRDASGRIVGGSEWKPNLTPVSTVSLSDLGTKALSWIKANVKNVDNAVFVDKDGNTTTDISKAVDVLSTSSGSVTSLGKDKVQAAIQAAIDMTPGARASIDQDYEVDNWKYNQLTPEEKNIAGATAVTDSNGRRLTKNEYLQNRLGSFYEAVPYTQNQVKTSYGTGLQTAFALKQKAKADAALQSNLNNGINYTGTGFNITYDTSDYLASTQATIEDAIKTIEGAMPQLTKSKRWQEAKATGNYDDIENIVRNIKTRSGQSYFDVANANVKNIVNGALTNIYNNKGFLADAYKNIDKDTKDAIIAKSAFDAGQKPSDNNEYAKTFYQLLDTLSDGKPAESYKITFNDKSDVTDFLSRMGMNEATARQNGMEFGYDNDFVTITIPQNNTYLPKAVLNFFDGDDDFFSLPWNRSSITALDAQGNDIGSHRRGTLLDNIGERIVGSWTTSNHFNNFNQILNNKVNRFNASGRGLRSTDQLKIADIPAVADAQRKYGIDSAEFGRVKKEVTDALEKKLANSDWTQLGVYGYNEDTRGLTIMHNEDRGEQMANIIGHLQNGKADVQFATNGIQHGYYVTLHEKLDKNGNVDSSAEPKTYFISSGVEDEAMNEFVTDSNTRAMGEYNRRRSVSGDYRNYLGYEITNISDNGALVNGNPISREQAVKLIEIDKLIDDTVNNIKGNINRFTTTEAVENALNLANVTIANYLGISPSSSQAIKIRNIIANKLK